MAKISISNLSSGFNSTTTLNNAFDAIETQLNSKVLYRDNPAGEPNQMENDLDMNGQTILNAGGIEVGGVDFLAQMQTIYDDYLALVDRVTISTSSPTGGSNGDIWFKVT
jgi:hypothetical protein